MSKTTLSNFIFSAATSATVFFSDWAEVRHERDRAQVEVSSPRGRLALEPLALEEPLPEFGWTLTVTADHQPVVVARRIAWALSALMLLALLLGTLVWHARVRSVHGWWLVAGVSALFFGAVFTAMRNLGVVPMNTVTQYGAQLGAALEIPLLMICLYLRSRDRRDALVRRAALQTRDAVTGLANDRVTRERVDHLVHRLALQPGTACVMRIRVGNLRHVFDEHGIQVMAGATLPIVTTGAVTSIVNETVLVEVLLAASLAVTTRV